MDEGAPSLTTIQEPPPPPTIYSTILSHNYHFRIFTSEFHRNTLLLFYSSFLWLAFAFAAAILLLTHSLRLEVKHP
jgi:hypothetical protein